MNWLKDFGNDIKEIFFPSKSWFEYEGETYHVVAEFLQAGTVFTTVDCVYTTTRPPSHGEFYSYLKEQLREKHQFASHVGVRIIAMNRIS